MRTTFALGFLWSAVFLSAQSPLEVGCQPGLEGNYPLVSAVYQRMGLACTFVEMPSARALVEVNTGTIDAEIGRTEGLASRYPGIIYTKEPLLMTGLVGWVLPSSKVTIGSAKDVAGHRVGILRGNKAAEQFVQSQSLAVESLTTLESLAKMLETQRIEIVLMPEAADVKVLSRIARKIDVGAVRYPVYHLFSRNHQDLAPRWDEVLREMKADGTYPTLLP